MAELSGKSLLHYDILERLGAGGMGEVWRARDTRLERDVAIKILPVTEGEDSIARQRFLREARSTSALIHPNIITVHEINRDAGLDFIVMEYVRGVSLSAMLSRGRLPVRQAVAYAVQIADALVAAHAAHIVHRDLKPGNIMIAESALVKVLDFGIAKRLQWDTQNPEKTATALTQEGMAVGTPSYMSPEQTLGEPLDERSDLFSFGIVFYQMLTGELPFTGGAKLTVMRKILNEAPRPIRELAAGIPDEVEAIVHRCLEKEPDSRYPSARKLLEDLRGASTTLEAAAIDAASNPTRTMAGISARRPGRVFRSRWVQAAVVAILVAASVYLIRQGASIHFGNRASAVESGQDPLDGRPSELTGRARDLLSRYDKPGYIDRAIRLLETALQRDSKFAPAYAALAQAYLRKGIGSTDKHWTVLAEDAARQAVAANSDLAAAHEILGEALMEKGDAAAADGEIRRTLQLDPLNASAYVTLANMSARADPKAAEQLFAKAISLAPTDWVPLAREGQFLYRKARYAEAVSAWKRALQNAPGNVSMLKNLAAAYHMLNEDDQAASFLQQALDIEPAGATWNNLGTLRFFQGHYTEAVAAFEKATKLDSANYLHWGNLGDAYRWAPGQREKATAAYLEAIRLLRESIGRNPQDEEAAGRLALYLAKAGQNNAALNELKAEVLKNPGPPGNFKKALTYEVLAMRERALQTLGEAVRGGYSLNEIESEPELASLRTDVRYHEMIAAIPRK